MADDLAQLEEAMFRAPPRGFTDARDALVAALKAQKGDWKGVKAYKRPSVVVWLWNRLARDQLPAALAVLDAAALLSSAIADGKAPADEVGLLRAAAQDVVAAART